MRNKVATLLITLLLPGCIAVQTVTITRQVSTEEAIARAAPQIRHQRAPRDSLAAEVGQRLNAERRARGLKSVSYNPQLSTVARTHAAWLEGANVGLQHTNAQGASPMTRTRAAGYKACRSAENLARGQDSAEQVMRDWMASDGHRANNLLPDVKEYGFALHPTRNHWVLLLAAPGC